MEKDEVLARLAFYEQLLESFDTGSAHIACPMYARGGERDGGLGDRTEPTRKLRLRIIFGDDMELGSFSRFSKELMEMAVSDNFTPKKRVFDPDYRDTFSYQKSIIDAVTANEENKGRDYMTKKYKATVKIKPELKLAALVGAFVLDKVPPYGTTVGITEEIAKLDGKEIVVEEGSLQGMYRLKIGLKEFLLKEDWLTNIEPYDGINWKQAAEDVAPIYGIKRIAGTLKQVVIDELRDYRPGEEYPFIGLHGEWKEARLVASDDLYQEVRDDGIENFGKYETKTVTVDEYAKMISAALKKDVTATDIVNYLFAKGYLYRLGENVFVHKNWYLEGLFIVDGEGLKITGEGRVWLGQKMIAHFQQLRR